jgi:hypothetical protein
MEREERWGGFLPGRPGLSAAGTNEEAGCCRRCSGGFGSEAMTSETVDRVLREVRGFPLGVRSWTIETGPDASGAEAVWVWVTLEDDAFDPRTTTQVRELIREAVHRRGGEHAPWVYVRFRGASEKVPA